MTVAPAGRATLKRPRSSLSVRARELSRALPIHTTAPATGVLLPASRRAPDTRCATAGRANRSAIVLTTTVALHRLAHTANDSFNAPVLVEIRACQLLHVRRSH